MSSVVSPASTSIEFLSTRSEHNPCFREGEFINSQGIKIRTYDRQPTGKKRGIVILVHGFQVHAMYGFLRSKNPRERHIHYEGSLPEKLNSLGLGVWLYDSQGHGLSEGVDGLRAYFDRFGDLVNDLVQFTSLVRKHEQNENLPVFACGSSMGGGMVAQTARVYPNLFNGIVLVAPLLSLEKSASTLTNRLLLRIGEYAAYYTPKAKVLHLSQNTEFPDSSYEFLNDPLNDTSTHARAKPVWEFYLFATDIIYNCHQITTPFLTIHSDKDTLTDPEGSKTLFRNTLTKDKTYLPVNDMWHVLFHETGRDKVIDSISKWIEERVDQKVQ